MFFAFLQNVQQIELKENAASMRCTRVCLKCEHILLCYAMSMYAFTNVDICYVIKQSLLMLVQGRLLGKAYASIYKIWAYLMLQNICVCICELCTYDW